MTVLALDLGSATGWALSRSGQVLSGTAAFENSRHEGGGMCFLRFVRFLEQLTEDCAGSVGSDLVCCYEKVSAHRGTHAAHVYGGFHATLTAWAEQHRIPYLGVPVGTIKLHATGRGNAGKPDVIAAMKALGYAPHDDNEADALALLHWALDPKAGALERFPPVISTTSALH